MIADAKQPTDEASHHFIKKATAFRDDGDPGAFDPDIEPTQIFHRILLLHALSVIGAKGDEVMFSDQQLRRLTHRSDIHDLFTRAEAIPCLPGWGIAVADFVAIALSDSGITGVKSRRDAPELRDQKALLVAGINGVNQELRRVWPKSVEVKSLADAMHARIRPTTAMDRDRLLQDARKPTLEFALD